MMLWCGDSLFCSVYINFDYLYSLQLMVYKSFDVYFIETLFSFRIQRNWWKSWHRNKRFSLSTTKNSYRSIVSNLTEFHPVLWNHHCSWGINVHGFHGSSSSLDTCMNWHVKCHEQNGYKQNFMFPWPSESLVLHEHWNESTAILYTLQRYCLNFDLTYRYVETFIMHIRFCVH